MPYASNDIVTAVADGRVTDATILRAKSLGKSAVGVFRDWGKSVSWMMTMLVLNMAAHAEIVVWAGFRGAAYAHRGGDVVAADVADVFHPAAGG